MSRMLIGPGVLMPSISSGMPLGSVTLTRAVIIPSLVIAAATPKGGLVIHAAGWPEFDEAIERFGHSDIASAVAEESADLYFEIQRLNEYGAESLDALAQAVDSLRRAVQSGDQARFTALMDAGREYTQGRQSLRERRA